MISYITSLTLINIFDSCFLNFSFFIICVCVCTENFIHEVAFTCTMYSLPTCPMLPILCQIHDLLVFNCYFYICVGVFVCMCTHFHAHVYECMLNLFNVAHKYVFLRLSFFISSYLWIITSEIIIFHISYLSFPQSSEMSTNC